MAPDAAPQRPLHAVTPLLESAALSARAGCRVFLKLDNTQPSGSFKVRGIGYLCQRAKAQGATAFYASSGRRAARGRARPSRAGPDSWPAGSLSVPLAGGNAGMAVAYCGRMLGVPTTIVIPKSTPAFMIERLRAEGANVIVHGAVRRHGRAPTRAAPPAHRWPAGLWFLSRPGLGRGAPARAGAAARRAQRDVRAPLRPPRPVDGPRVARGRDRGAAAAGLPAARGHRLLGGRRRPAERHR